MQLSYKILNSAKTDSYFYNRVSSAFFELSLWINRFTSLVRQYTRVHVIFLHITNIAF